VPERPALSPEAAFVLVDKQAGWTSFAEVQRARRATGAPKAGHAGTLDPMATGLLVVALGRATRLLRYFSGLQKRYVGSMLLGFRSDTYDSTGRMERVSSFEGDLEEVAEAARKLEGVIEQTPPAFSAVHVGGRRAYELARRGQEPELKPRRVVVERFEITGKSGEVVEFAVACSSGTYVRSLVHELGELLGCGAVLSSLRRTAVGHLRVEDAVPAEAAAEGLLAVEEALSHLSRVTVRDEALRKKVVSGAPLARVDLPGEGEPPFAVVDEGGRLLAVYGHKQHGTLAPEVVWAPGRE
jgi:tRNA pseudouridine55 synthase